MITAPADLRLGERGFRAPWVSVVCPTLLPEGIMEVLEDCLGNKTAHEMALLMAAANEHMALHIAEVRHVVFPGMWGSQVPSFRRIRSVVWNIAEVTRWNGVNPLGGDDGADLNPANVEERIEAYMRLLETCKEEEEPEPEAI